ncbi:MAG: hypothetical protein IJL91_03370, partial [Bacteroidales bacterium]|nr:hypothetical protein [Bacteroidales bacterium]
MIRPDIVESILEKPYWLIDVLPKQVPAGSPGQYFKVERYFLSRLDEISRKFALILIRLNCYYDLKMSSDGETWILNASPGDLARRFEESAASHSPLSVLIGSDDALVTFSGDDHYMTIYNPDEELLELVRQCAQAEGLFV